MVNSRVCFANEYAMHLRILNIREIVTRTFIVFFKDSSALRPSLFSRLQKSKRQL